MEAVASSDRTWAVAGILEENHRAEVDILGVEEDDGQEVEAEVQAAVEDGIRVVGGIQEAEKVRLVEVGLRRMADQAGHQVRNLAIARVFDSDVVLLL